MESRIIRTIDHLGRIVIPKEMRRRFNIQPGEELGIWVEGNRIKLRPLQSTCVFCGSTEQVRAFRSKGICANCLSEL